MNPADKFLIFFGLLDLFYGYPLDFGPIIHPQFFFLYTGYFDSVKGFVLGEILQNRKNQSIVRKTAVYVLIYI